MLVAAMRCPGDTWRKPEADHGTRGTGVNPSPKRPKVLRSAMLEGGIGQYGLSQCPVRWWGQPMRPITEGNQELELGDNYFLPRDLFSPLPSALRVARESTAMHSDTLIFEDLEEKALAEEPNA